MPGMAGMDRQEHPSAAASSYELEFFPSLEALSGLNSPSPLDREADAAARVDTVFGYVTHGFHLFGEYLLTNHESDVERLQLGYELDPETMLWIGRYHQPASAWNFDHHHGQYLQTSISRPAIALWEDEDGLIPQHIVGALLESHRPLGNTHGVQFAAGVGAAPMLDHEGLHPIAVFGSNPGPYRFSADVRLGYLPDYAGTDLLSLLYSHNEFALADPVARSDLRASAMQMDLPGLQFDFSSNKWRFLGAGYYVFLHYSGLGPPHSEHFAAGYVQVERTLGLRWTLYARIEPSSNTEQSLYVRMLPERDDWPFERDLGGVRWDFIRRQALTLEYAFSNTASGHYNELRLQWSAAFP
jgi:hypothetical protein